MLLACDVLVCDGSLKDLDSKSRKKLRLPPFPAAGPAPSLQSMLLPFMGNRGTASMAYGDGRIGQLLMQLGENVILLYIDIDPY